MLHKLYKLLIFNITFILIILITVSCSISEKFVYHPDINQGNYFTDSDIAKIKKGLTQKQVSYILGTPILKNLFDRQNWYYIFHQQSRGKIIKQQILILTFDNNGVLINIKYNNKLHGIKNININTTST